MSTNKSLDNLQKLIDTKALNKLKEDIHQIDKLIKDNYTLFADITVTIIVPEKYRKPMESDSTTREIKLKNFINYFDEIIIEERLPAYTEAETREFIEKVDGLQNQIDELKDINNNRQDD